jgi:hypothetical protein
MPDPVVLLSATLAIIAKAPRAGHSKIRLRPPCTLAAAVAALGVVAPGGR